MITKIPVKKFKPVDKITIEGLTKESCYLNQYFQNFENGEIIHANYTDYDDSCSYELVTGLFKATGYNGKEYIAERSIYLGMAKNYWQCIFDEDYPDVIGEFVELDTERC